MKMEMKMKMETPDVCARLLAWQAFETGMPAAVTTAAQPSGSSHAATHAGATTGTLAPSSSSTVRLSTIPY